MPILVRHPDTPPGAINWIEAELVRTDKGAIATFRAWGDVEQLIIPPPANAVRTDELWKATCFELFLSAGDGGYREYNFSPSGAWAAYDFDGYRSGMRPANASVSIQKKREANGLTLVANIRDAMALPANVGLAAVVEERDGQQRYWASSFAPGKPDFHAAAVRSLLFDGVSAE